eukprot:Awhi_evm1s5843
MAQVELDMSWEEIVQAKFKMEEKGLKRDVNRLYRKGGRPGIKRYKFADTGDQFEKCFKYEKFDKCINCEKEVTCMCTTDASCKLRNCNSYAKCDICHH